LNNAIVEMKGIDKNFGSVKALNNVNFEIIAGKVNVLIGENGAGKSTLMKILSGAYQMDDGEILIDEKHIDIDNPIDAEKAGVGTIYQELNLVPKLSITENIFLGRDMVVNGFGVINWNATHKKAEGIMYDLLGIKIDPRLKICDLGIAQQQMIEIVKVLNRNSRIIIMDEPTAALTEKEIKMLFGIIDKLKKDGIAIVYISHRLEEIFIIGDRVTVLKDGENVGTVSVEDINTDELIKMMVGREITNQYPRIDDSKSVKNEVLRVEGLTIKGSFNDISFNVTTGEVLGIAGLMGAGRTEIARAIFGADQIDSGRIYIDGVEKKITSPSEAIKNGIALLPEDRKAQGLIVKRCVLENISAANLSKFCNKMNIINTKKEKEEADEYIENLRIVTPSSKKIVKELSGGNQQKVVLAKWLCADSKIIIFDEPTRGIDVGAKVEVYKLINKLVEQNRAVIVISSELLELIGICTRILTVKNGRIVKEFRGSATEEEIVSAMIGGN